MKKFIFYELFAAVQTFDESVQRKFGAGLESWADLRLAAKFIGIMTPQGPPERAQLWSQDWTDRAWAAAFVSEARRLHDESAAQLAAYIDELSELRSNASEEEDYIRHLSLS